MSTTIYAPVLWGYGANTCSNGLRLLSEHATMAAVGSWVDLVGSQVSEEDEIKKRFWAWTRYPEYGVWALTTVGIIKADGTMGYAIGSFDAVSAWSTEPRTGATQAGNWWLFELLQSPRPPSIATSISMPIQGTLTWRESACTGTITTTIEFVDNVHSWFAVRKTVTGSITDSVTGNTEVINYMQYPTYSEPLADDPEDDGPWILSVDIDSTSSASTEAISLGADNIKTWDYYKT